MKALCLLQFARVCLCFPSPNPLASPRIVYLLSSSNHIIVQKKRTTAHGRPSIMRMYPISVARSGASSCDRFNQDKTHCCIASLLFKKSGFVSETSIQIGLGQQTLKRHGSFFSLFIPSFLSLFLRSVWRRRTDSFAAADRDDICGKVMCTH